MCFKVFFKKTISFLLAFILGTIGGNLFAVRKLSKVENKSELIFSESKQPFVLQEKKTKTDTKRLCVPTKFDLEKLYSKNSFYKKLVKERAEILNELKRMKEKNKVPQNSLQLAKAEIYKFDLRRIDRGIEEIKRKIEITQNLVYVENCYKF